MVFTTFITLYWIFMIPMGGAQDFNQSFNVSEDQLSATPSFDTPEETVYHLENDAVSSTNVKFYNVSDVDGEVGFFTSVQDYNTNVVVGRDGSTGSSSISYAVEGWEQLEILATNRPLESSDITLTWERDNTSRTIYGPMDLEVPEDETAFTIEFGEGTTDQYLYFAEGQRGDRFEGVTGALNLFFRWIGSILGYILGLASITAQLPIYLNIPFGLYIGYLLYKAVTMA